MPAKRITVSLGILAIPLKIEVATEDSGPKTHAACTGSGKHPVSRVKARVACPACGEEHSSVHGFPERCVDVDGELVLLGAEELADAKGVPRTGRAGTPANPDVAGVELKFHTRESVFGSTLPDDSVQNVYPDRAGEKAYALLVEALVARPDLVGVMIWAPTTRNSLWALEVVEGRLVIGKRTWPEQVRTPAEVAPIETSEADRAMFAQIVAMSATEFEMAEYVDEASRGINELVAAAAPEVVPADVSTALADMLAKLEEAGAKPSDLKPVKARAKKKVAA